MKIAMWKEKIVKPSATLWEGAEQLKICDNCGPLPLENFSDDGKYEKLCINCEAERRSLKDYKYNHSERRRITDEMREEKAKKELDKFLLDIQE